MVTFFIPRTNVIESDQGFSVEILGKTGIEYRDSDRVIWIDSEILAGKSGIILYSQNMRLIASKDMRPSDLTDRDLIVENVRSAFRFRGFEIQVV